MNDQSLTDTFGRTEVEGHDMKVNDVANGYSNDSAPWSVFDDFQKLVESITDFDFMSTSLVLSGGEYVRRLHTTHNASNTKKGDDKKMGGTPWGKHVLERGKTLIGRNEKDIVWAFPDHAAIIGAGYRSYTNVPVTWAGKTIGTINVFSSTPDYFSEEVVARIKEVSYLLVAPMLGVQLLPEGQ